MTDGLRLKDVVVARRSFTLGPLSLEVEPGEALWLVGVNGSGKSTLLEAVAGLRRIAAGEISIGGVPLSSSTGHVEPHGRAVSILLQEHGLWPHLTIEAQCRLVGRSSSGTAGLGAEPLRSWARQLDVENLLGRRPGQLSGGEAQRAALLRSIAHEGTVLLLDEPFSAQHDEGVERIENVIASLRAQGKIIVGAGHRVPEGGPTFELHKDVSGAGGS